MSVRHLLWLLALSSVLLAGCRNLCRRDPPRPYGAPLPPLPSGSRNIPPQNIPDGPPLPPTPRGSSGGTELLLPEPIPGKSKSDYPTYPEMEPLPKAQPITPRAKVYETPPMRPQPAPVEEQPKPKSSVPRPLDEPRAEARRPQPSVEVATGIEEFTVVKEGVSAGLRPTLEGLDWLAAKGYKAVVYLRRTDDDDTTDRRQLEKRDLKFVSMVVKPEELNQAFLDEFNTAVGKLDQRPIFVYARDGNVAAAVWYMHLRSAEYLTHDEAKVRIARLGFKDDTNEYFKAALQFFEKP